MSETSAQRAVAASSLRGRRLSRHGPLLAGIVALAVLTWYFTAHGSPFALFVFSSGLMACIGALGLNLLTGTAGLVSIGHAGFLAIGGFTVVLLQGGPLTFPFDIAIAVVVGAAAGAIVGLPALRVHGLELALATLAAHYIIHYFANGYQDRDIITASAGFTIDPLLEAASPRGEAVRWAWLLLIVVVVSMLAVRALAGGRTGRALRMVRDHPIAAETLGIRVARQKIVMFSLSAAMFALQGALLAYFWGSVSSTNYTIMMAIEVVAMIVIGGLDSVAGAVFGALVVTAMPAILPDIAGLVMSEATAARRGPQISQILYGILLVVFITGSTGGLVGMAQRLRRRVRVTMTGRSRIRIDNNVE